MSKLEIHFDIPNKETFNRGKRAIIDHLTPSNEDLASRATRFALERVRQQLNETPGALEFEVRGRLDWSRGGNYARDLGLSTESEEILEQRYRIPHVLGSTTSHDISLFGNRATGVGDHPLTVRITSDDAGIGDNLYLLRSWRDEFRERGARLIEGDIAEVQKRTGGVSPEHDKMLDNLPRSEGDYDAQIAKQTRQLNSLLATEAVNLVRFAEDFIGRPLRQEGILPVAAEMQGPYNFELLIDPQILEAVSQFPTLDTEEALKLLIPELTEDVNFIKTD